MEDNTKVLMHHFGDIKYGTQSMSLFSIPEYVGNIHYIDSGCSCTSYLLDKDLGTLTFMIDTTQVGATEGEHKVIHKSPILYLDSSVPEFVPDERLKKIPNPQKKRIVFTLTGGCE